MKFRFSTFLTTVFSSFLAFLGFSSCDNDNGSEISMMYGSPYGEFKFSGLVTDEEGNPIKDARVIVRTHTDEEGSFFMLDSDTVATNASGEYKGERDTWVHEARIVCQDPKGDFLPDSTVVALDYTKDRNETWYMGTANVTTNFTLKKDPKGEDK
ncbi:MAG: radical SAM-associated putative lipoprotein [Muribaculaceae bacterium]|nr:radical SAM-associated putative lipoprotein [Muribaculaceae bacterium]